MKKINLLLLCLILLVTGCSKTSIDSKKFKKIMRNNDYRVISTKGQFKDYDYILESYIAENDNYQIEFYIMEDSENAKAFYDLNKDVIDANRTNTSIYKETNLNNNNNKYILTTNDSYMLISQIDSTVIYLNINKKYKEEINKIIKKLGY